MGDGLGVGDNTRSAVITRGLAEMTRLGVAMGGRAETFSGLAGMGDLIATCISPQSRNRHVGEQLGRGRTIDEIIAEMHMVAEGVKTTRVVLELAERVRRPDADRARGVRRAVRRGARRARRIAGWSVTSPGTRRSRAEGRGSHSAHPCEQRCARGRAGAAAARGSLSAAQGRCHAELRSAVAGRCGAAGCTRPSCALPRLRRPGPPPRAARAGFEE